MSSESQPAQEQTGQDLRRALQSSAALAREVKKALDQLAKGLPEASSGELLNSRANW